MFLSVLQKKSVSQRNLSKLTWYVISERDSEFAVFDVAAQTSEQTLIKKR